MNKSYILKKNEDIKELFNKKKSVGNRYFSIYYEKTKSNNKEKDFKMVVSVSKKVGKAHLRNYLRRVIKEIIRMNMSDYCNLHILIIVKGAAIKLSYQEKETELLKLINKIRGVKDEK